MLISLPFVPVELVIRRKPVNARRPKLRDAMIGIAGFAVVLGVGMHLSNLGDRARRFDLLARSHANEASRKWWLAGQTSASAAHAGRDASAAEGLARDLLARGDRAGAEARTRDAKDRAATAARLAESANRVGREAAFEDELAKKYGAAKDRPLWPVWPDPPAP